MLDSARRRRIAALGDSSSVLRLFKYVPGMSIGDMGASFTRATNATYFDVNGVLQTAGSGVLRDGHYIGGVRTTLSEGARTNLAIHSQVFAAWTSASVTATDNNAVAPDGTTTAALLALSAGGSTSNIHETLTYTGDGTKVMSVFLKPGTATVNALQIWDNTASVSRQKVSVTWSGGVPTVANISGAGTIFPVTACTNGWYRIAFAANSVVAANANQLYIYPDNGGTNGNTVYAWGAMGEDASSSSSYIPTTTAAVTRNADALTFPIAFTPQALTLYTKLFLLEPSSATSGERIMEIGNGGGIRLASDVETPNAKGFWHNGTSLVNSTTALTSNYGDTLEDRLFLTSAGVVNKGITINAGAETVGTASGANAFSGSPWGANTLNVGMDGTGANHIFGAYQKLLIASQVNSLNVMRNL